MQALSTKLYYDVLKSGLEDTILESDFEDERGNSPRSTSDVGCSARTHMKSNAIQTQWNHNGKNFRHEFTNTNKAKLLKRPNSRVIAIHRSVSCEDIAVTRMRGVQTTSSVDVPIVRGKKSVAVDFFRSQVVNNIATSTQILHSTPRVDDYVRKRTDCDQSDKCQKTIKYDCYGFVPCNRGLVACQNFTLGTADFRRSQKDNCCTKIIGGSRVPIRKRLKF